MMAELRNCPDCGVAPGEYHNHGCDIEVCPTCGHQYFACDCIYEFFGINSNDFTMEKEWSWLYENGPTEEMMEIYEKHINDKCIKWDGELPHLKECREYGFWCKWVDGKGWVKCTVDDPDPGRMEDRNTLMQKCAWNVDLKRYVLV